MKKSFTSHIVSMVVLCFIAMSNTSFNIIEKTRFLILPGSSLKINGSTNINTFNCEINNYTNPDTIYVEKKDELSIINLNGTMNINVEGFDCHNNFMTSDLRKTLRSKEFPRLYIHFVSFNNNQIDFKKIQQNINGTVDITIAGIVKRFDINYQYIIDSKNIIHLIGERTINFSDFNLIPPRKLGGMIKVNNSLFIEFHLAMKSI